MPSQACIGVLGELGAGIALMGIGVLALAVAECLEEVSADCGLDIEDSSLEPAVQEPAPVPESAPGFGPAPTVECQEQVIAPPPELSEVAEPTPPAEKVEMMSFAESSTEMASGSSGEASTKAGDSSLEQGQTQRTHKAGTW